MKNESINQNNNKKGRELFYGVIAISIFIVMAVGATFAYFTATTKSTNTAVQTSSTSLQLDYISYSKAWIKEDLIPADTRVVEYSFEQQNDTTAKKDEDGITYLKNNTLCVDDYGNSICSVYEFQIKNTANSPLTVNLSIVSTINEFSSLNAMAYQLTLPENGTQDYTDYNSIENNNGTNDPKFKTDAEDTTAGAIQVENGTGNPIYTPNYNPIYINRKGAIKTLLKYTETKTPEEGGEAITSTGPAIDKKIITVTDEFLPTDQRTANLANNIEIQGGETLTFAIVLYIKNEDIDQTETDARKKFTGQVVVSSGDGDTGVSGTISALTGSENDLQSAQP